MTDLKQDIEQLTTVKDYVAANYVLDHMIYTNGKYVFPKPDDFPDTSQKPLLEVVFKDGKSPQRIVHYCENGYLWTISKKGDMQQVHPVDHRDVKEVRPISKEDLNLYPEPPLNVMEAIRSGI